MAESDVLAPTKYVTLASCDGYEFVVLRKAVLVSSTIKGMLDPKSESLPTPNSPANDRHRHP